MQGGGTVKRLCPIGFVEVCLGPEPDGSPCSLCERKERREWAAWERRLAKEEASRG